jgi:predicted acylesterase/phospholipase RssA
VDRIMEQRARDLGRKVSFVSLLDRMSDIQIQQNTLLSLRLTPPDVHAVMRQYAYNTFDFDKAEQIIADGKRIMNEALDKYENQ